MNLGKLLFAGRSVVAAGERIEYRQDKNGALPKFESRKNPFTPKKTAGAPNGDRLEACPTRSEAPAAAVAPPMPAVPAAPKSPGSWKDKLNPASIWRGPQAEAKSDGRPGVQEELSLDSVKVVHNDLSDTDVTVVPLKSRPAAVVPELPPAKKSWEILGERLLKATAL